MTQINIHDVKSISLKNDFFNANDKHHSFHRILITVIDKDGKENDINLFSLKKLNIEN